MSKIARKISDIEASIYREASHCNIRKVLVALSGGADSVATAFALKKAGIDTTALHCNFHLRGEESNRDMKFVEDFCSRFQIPLEIKEFETNEYLKSNKGESLEMACRKLRHEWFDDMLSKKGADRIVTGHNADDNIETFFLNMLRGAGSRGLKGMSADSGRIWRPLLQYHRTKILEYLADNNLEYVTDSTNLQSDYRRNYLRNKIIPLFRDEWKGFDKAMDTTIQNLVNENRVVESFIENLIPAPLQPLSVDVIINSPAPLLLIKRYVDPLGPFSTTPQEILAAIKANKPHIRKWRLKNGVVFLRNRNLFVEMCHGESCT